MATNRPQAPLPQGENAFSNIFLRIRLIARLMADGRVSPLLKILPAFGLLYFIVPDLLPGPVDDGALLWLGSYLFVTLCPPQVVDEHWRGLTGKPYHAGAPPAGTRPQDDEVIDAEFRDLDR